jgi:hypothetical protein
LADKFDDIACGTDHDLAFERQLPSERCAQSRFAHVFTDNKRADRANVHDTKFRQLLRDQRRLASITPTNIYGTKKYDRRHGRK